MLLNLNRSSARKGRMMLMDVGNNIDLIDTVRLGRALHSFLISQETTTNGYGDN